MLDCASGDEIGAYALTQHVGDGEFCGLHANLIEDPIGPIVEDAPVRNWRRVEQVVENRYQVASQYVVDD